MSSVSTDRATCQHAKSAPGPSSVPASVICARRQWSAGAAQRPEKAASGSVGRLRSRPPMTALSAKPGVGRSTTASPSRGPRAGAGTTSEERCAGRQRLRLAWQQRKHCEHSCDRGDRLAALVDARHILKGRQIRRALEKDHQQPKRQQDGIVAAENGREAKEKEKRAGEKTGVRLAKHCRRDAPTVESADGE